MVSITIMVVILSMVAFNQSRYTTGASLKNDANSISLSLRQAQVYGVSVKEFSPGTNDFSSAYGVSFNIISGSGSNNAYIFFADRISSQNGEYDNTWACPLSPTSECLDKTILSKGNTISSLCIIYSSDINDNGTCNLGRIDVTFLRPSTEAKIAFFNNAMVRMSPPPVRGARINLVSASGTNSIIIYTTGQISVQ